VASWFKVSFSALAVPVWLAISGCGYSHTGSAPGKNDWYQWKSLYREDVRTVSVPIFKNRTFYRGIENSLTKALVNTLEADTPYKVAPQQRADTVLEGEVEDVKLRTVSNGSLSAIPQEQLYVVRVNFVWKDLRTGRILCQRQNFEQDASFYPTLGEGLYVGQQTNVERLAQGIVEELQADW
jgi:hypothetical protein